MVEKKTFMVSVLKFNHRPQQLLGKVRRNARTCDDRCRWARGKRRDFSPGAATHYPISAGVHADFTDFFTSFYQFFELSLLWLGRYYSSSIRFAGDNRIFRVFGAGKQGNFGSFQLVEPSQNRVEPA